MKKLLNAVFLIFITLPAHAEVKGIGDVTPGLSDFAEQAVNLLAGPLGLLLALFGVLGAFFETKFSESKALIFTTLLLSVGPFLLAILLKALYFH